MYIFTSIIYSSIKTFCVIFFFNYTNKVSLRNPRLCTNITNSCPINCNAVRCNEPGRPPEPIHQGNKLGAISIRTPAVPEYARSQQRRQEAPPSAWYLVGKRVPPGEALARGGTRSCVAGPMAGCLFCGRFCGNLIFL